MQACLVATLDPKQIEKLKKDLPKQDFEVFDAPNAIFGAKKPGISLVVYRSGKITIQGKEKKEWVEFYFEPEILKDCRFSHDEAYLDTIPRIGSDEAGKGDFFGPLVICALYANESDIKELSKLGIKDSKKISDKKNAQLAREIKKHARYSVIAISPAKYNELYKKFKNLNELMAWAHTRALEVVYEDTKCKKIIVDKFASPSLIENRLKKKKLQLDVTQIPRAEADIVVAAASILARDGFLKGLQKLSDEYSINLPKGASSLVIQVGKNFAKKYGVNELEKVAKTHFKTYLDVTKDL